MKKTASAGHVALISLEDRLQQARKSLRASQRAYDALKNQTTAYAASLRLLAEFHGEEVKLAEAYVLKAEELVKTYAEDAPPAASQ